MPQSRLPPPPRPVRIGHDEDAAYLQGGADRADRHVDVLVVDDAHVLGDDAVAEIRDRLAADTRQSFVVDNRGGAATAIGAEMAARAPADGYTVLYVNASTMLINPVIHPNPGYDPFRDFTPVVPLVSVPNILVVHPSVQATSVRELIALAGRQPGALFYGSSGVGTAPHLSGELFNLLAEVRMTHVPYPGSAQAVTDLVAGRVGVMFSPASTVLGHIREGRLRALASTGAARASSAPDLPTMEEAGLAGFTSTVWFGLVAPPATPDPVVARLAAAARAALAEPEVSRQLAAQGFDILPGGPAELRALIASEIAKWARVIEASGARGT